MKNESNRRFFLDKEEEVIYIVLRGKNATRKENFVHT